ncbi:MAG: DinB family protein [Mucilaginibacter sp.]
MTKAIETLKQPRIKILEELQDFSLEQLNDIPTGFNNNIIWNLGHMIAAQQGICYARSGVDKLVSDEFFMAYKPGSKPEKFIDQPQYDNIKELLFSTLVQLETDLKNNLFVNYTPVMTRYNVELTNIQDAIEFLPFHEGLHIGYIMSLRKIVKK